jgi:hypothetical protein
MADGSIPLKKWALYVFFGANVPEAAVRDAAVQNLLQMARVGSSDEVAVAAQLHLPGRWAYRYAMPPRPPGSGKVVVSPVDTIPNENSASPKTIIEFFAWAATHFPADQTMLVVWGHGYGLDDYLPRGARPHPPSTIFTDFEDVQIEVREESKSTILIDQITPALATSAALVSGILDDCAHEVLPNEQLAAAVKGCQKVITYVGSGRTLAILGIDACLMAMAEVWSELADLAQIGIASEANEPDASFPYDRFLARLELELNLAKRVHPVRRVEPEEVAKMMVDAYVESYAYQKETFVTLSACDLRPGIIQVLTKSIQQLTKSLIIAAEDPFARKIIFRARNDSPIFDPDGFIDLGRFCQILQVTLDNKEVHYACGGVLGALREFIRYARYSPLDPTLRISQSTGLSVWFPPWLENASADYPEKDAAVTYLIYGYPLTAFARDTQEPPEPKESQVLPKSGWGNFLLSMWGPRQCQNEQQGLLV